MPAEVALASRPEAVAACAVRTLAPMGAGNRQENPALAVLTGSHSAASTDRRPSPEARSARPAYLRGTCNLACRKSATRQ